MENFNHEYKRMDPDKHAGIRHSGTEHIFAIMRAETPHNNAPWIPGSSLDDNIILGDGELVILKNGLLGEGGFGVAYKGYVKAQNGDEIPVAIKIAKQKSDIIPQSTHNELLLHAVRSMDPFCSRQVLCLYMSFASNFNSASKSEYYYGFVTELMDGDIRSLAEKSSKATAKSKIYLFMYLMLHVIYDLATLHEHQIAHNDLKTDNVFYKLDKSSKKMRVKLGDLGLSCFFPSQKIKLDKNIWRRRELELGLDSSAGTLAWYANAFSNQKISCPGLSTIALASREFVSYMDKDKAIPTEVMRRNDIYMLGTMAYDLLDAMGGLIKPLAFDKKKRTFVYKPQDVLGIQQKVFGKSRNSFNTAISNAFKTILRLLDLHNQPTFDECIESLSGAIKALDSQKVKMPAF